jgi:hypothetical protein
MLILTYLNSILKNPYFYLEPYIHQILTLILSLILLENNNYTIELVIHVKDYAVHLLKTLYLKYEMKYPNFMTQLIEVFKDNLSPIKDGKTRYLTSYGAIKGINILGPAHITNIILPNLDLLLSQVFQDHYIQMSIPINNSLNETIIIDEPSQKISFSQFQTIPQNINSSLFDNSNIVKSEMVVDDGFITKTKLSIKDRKKAYFVYYALKVILFHFRNQQLFCLIISQK